VPLLAGGSHAVTVTYNGSGNFAASTSALTQVVERAATATALTVSSPTFFNHAPVTLTATVASLPAGLGTPTGSVTFFDGGTPLGTVPLTGGTAALTTTRLGLGGHALRAVYSGDGNFGPSSAQASATNVGLPIFVTTARVRGRTQVRVFNFGGSPRFSFFPYPRSFHGPVHVALGDVNGDGFPDVVVAAGRGTPQRVKVINGLTGALLQSIRVAPPGFARGVFVAAGDVNGDGRAEVVVGIGPEVRVYDGLSGAQLLRFSPFPPRSGRAVRVVALDLNGDGVDEVIALRGSLASPEVKAFDGRTLAELPAVQVTPFLAAIIALASR
jgi:Bacterial Ig-like domain (group 3)/FG-GAP-like repeat